MSAEFWKRHGLKIVERYMWSGPSGEPLEEVRIEMKNKCESECKCGPAPSDKQYKDFFRLCGVFKNNGKDEVDAIQSKLAQRTLPEGFYLILADGMLLDPLKVQQYRGKGKKNNDDACRRSIELIEIPCPIPALKDPHKFRVFQRFLWLAAQHFNSCFDRDEWKKKGGDLYGGGGLRADLKKLSSLHNMLVDACRHPENWEVMEPEVFNTLQVVATTNHHRQMPDILAVLLLLERSGRSDLKASLVQRLCDLAESMDLNDPRRSMLDSLNSLSIDKDGHLPLAFDSCCRDLWRRKFEGDDLMAYYTYYQAAFPRSTPTTFYYLFEEESRGDVDSILDQVDQRFPLMSHPMFCLWHMAINFLFEKQRYVDAEAVSNRLVQRVQKIGDSMGQDPQSFYDSVMSLFYRGKAQEMVGRTQQKDDSLMRAKEDLESALRMRQEYLRDHPNAENGTISWDAPLKVILRALVSVTEVLGLFEETGRWHALLERMYRR